MTPRARHPEINTPKSNRSLLCNLARTKVGKATVSLGVCATLLVAASLPALLAAGSANAQTVPGLAEVDPNAQLFLEADELLYDDAANTVTAVGTVQLFYDGYTVNADQVIYDRGRSRVLASGNVVLVEPSGNVLRASSADLSDTLADGFVDALEVETTERSFFTARTAVRESATRTRFEDGTYTACSECEEDPEKPRAWMMHADEIIYDEDDQMVYYRNVRLDFFGIPLAWVPFFAHADPTVTRKSGFLQPNFVIDSELGGSLSTPYFFALAPHYDLTITPTVHTAQGLHLNGEWRHRTSLGQYSFRASGIHQFDRDVFSDPGDRDWRGGIATNGAFNLNPRWNAGWNLYFQSDRRYFRDYDIEQTGTEVVSDIYLTGLHDRSYLDARIERIEVTNSDTQNQPWALPTVDYDRRFTPGALGGELKIAANFTSVLRDDAYVEAVTLPTGAGSLYEGLDGQYTRASLDVSWRREFIGPLGQVFTPQIGFRGDAIRYDLGPTASLAGLDSRDATLFRAMPSAGLEWRWPILMTTPSSSHVFEPMAQVIVRPDATAVGEVPVEDSQSLVFDASNLFDWDKFSGYDQIEGGTRANVGVRYTGTFANGLSVQALVGQSFHLAGENPYATTTLVRNEANSGLETDQSDYVAMLSAQLNGQLSLTTSGRFDEDDFSIERGEVIAAASHGPVSSSVTYAYIAEQPGRGYPDEQHQIRAAAALNVTDEWRLSGSLQYDIENSDLLGFGAGIAYSCDCLDFALTYTQTFSEANDGETDRRLMLNFALRTIGGAEARILDDNAFDHLGVR